MQLRPTSMLLFAIVPVRRIRAGILRNRYWSFNLILIVWVIHVRNPPQNPDFKGILRYGNIERTGKPLHSPPLSDKRRVKFSGY
jgi:hypothetical protein